jgi:hypothetical protein
MKLLRYCVNMYRAGSIRISQVCTSTSSSAWLAGGATPPILYADSTFSMGSKPMNLFEVRVPASPRRPGWFGRLQELIDADAFKTVGYVAAYPGYSHTRNVRNGNWRHLCDLMSLPSTVRRVAVVPCYDWKKEETSVNEGWSNTDGRVAQSLFVPAPYTCSLGTLLRSLGKIAPDLCSMDKDDVHMTVPTQQILTLYYLRKEGVGSLIFCLGWNSWSPCTEYRTQGLAVAEFWTEGYQCLYPAMKLVYNVVRKTPSSRFH